MPIILPKNMSLPSGVNVASNITREVIERANELLGDIQTGSVGNSHALLQKELDKELPKDKYSIISRFFGKGNTAFDQEVNSLLKTTLLVVRALDTVKLGTYDRLLAVLSAYGYIFLTDKEIPVRDLALSIPFLLEDYVGIPDLDVDIFEDEFNEYVLALSKIRDNFPFLIGSIIKAELTPLHLLSVNLIVKDVEKPAIAVSYLYNKEDL